MNEQTNNINTSTNANTNTICRNPRGKRQSAKGKRQRPERSNPDRTEAPEFQAPPKSQAKRSFEVCGWSVTSIKTQTVQHGILGTITDQTMAWIPKNSNTQKPHRKAPETIACLVHTLIQLLTVFPNDSNSCPRDGFNRPRKMQLPGRNVEM